ncbi:hypothetical protein [Amycolatopsis sp. NPDC059657]|uniref:hypothetical protein n=1 Tax=Amycolatopsis sp. NPDC059657 TaxID=3346899 RepID=UPI0036716378
MLVRSVRGPRPAGRRRGDTLRRNHYLLRLGAFFVSGKSCQRDTRESTTADVSSPGNNLITQVTDWSVATTIKSKNLLQVKVAIVLTDLMVAASRDYSAFMSCEARPAWLDEALHQLGEWFREKYFDVDLSTDGLYAAENRTLKLQRHSDVHSRSLRAQLSETGTNWGTWNTELLLHERHGSEGWVSISVQNEQGRFVDVPRIARYLMRTLPLGDGRVRFVDGAQVFRADDVPRLVEMLTDEKRHGLIFVAGTTGDSIPFDAFASHMGVWTKQVYGLGQVVVLDPWATEAFNAIAGLRYQAPPWAVRTFFPEVNFGSELDWRRHRILGSARLGAMDDSHIERMLGAIARRHASTRATSGEVTRVVRKFERLANSALLIAIDPKTTLDVLPTTVPVDPGVAEGADFQHQVELVKQILQIKRINEPTLRAIAQSITRPLVEPVALAEARRRVETKQTQLELTQDALQAAKSALDDDQLERAEIYEDLERANAEIRWLRHSLQTQGDRDVAFGVLPEEWREDYPQGFGDLLDRIPDLVCGRLRFTGDRSVALSVDDHDTLQLAARTAWDACLALGDYLRARDEEKCDKGVDYYLRHTPSGYIGITPGKHAATETGTTMRSHGEERVFPVPNTVDPSGRRVMKAHFKLAQIGMVSPRMYYLDDYNASRSIYIGYIGPHLANTHTN